MKTISSFFLISLTLLALLTGWAHAGSVEKIYTLPAEKIAGHIIKQPGRKVVFIYATWCPYCREKIPALIELESAKPGSVYPVSIDES